MKKINIILISLAIILLSTSCNSNGNVNNQKEFLYNDKYDKDFNPNNFMNAVLKNNLSKVEIFLGKGINPNITDSDGRTALMHAAYNENILMIKLLIKSGADPNIEDNYGNSAIKIAKDKKNDEILNSLTTD